MALTVKEMQDTLGEQFQLRLICGQSGLNAVFTWVHMLEDTTVVDFFWGNEIVVTSGYVAHDEESLLQLIRVLNAKRCAAVVINTGKYIHEIPQSIIDYCEQEQIPLFTLPWHMSMIEFVRTCCTKLTQSSLSEEDLAQAVIRAVNAPQDPGGYYSQLSKYFSEEVGFRMLAVNIRTQKSVHTQEMIMDQRTTLRLHTAMRGVSFHYLIFRNDKRVFILLNNRDRKTADHYAGKVFESIRRRFPDIPMQIGIGDDVQAFENLQDAYHSALSAQRCASIQGHDIVAFSDIGFYRLIYSVPNDDLLRSYYYDTVGVLIEYDKQHNTNLLETLFSYLNNDRSPQAVAKDLFTHRNTVNYRISKIKEITGWNFDQPADRIPFLLAYHIGLILKL